MRRLGGGGTTSLPPGGRRASAVASSGPAVAEASFTNGRWKTTPGGWAGIELMTGRLLRGRYASVTAVSCGAGPVAAVVNTARHCMNRAAGLVTISPSRLVYGADQSLQESSGRSVLPDRVASVTEPVAS